MAVRTAYLLTLTPDSYELRFYLSREPPGCKDDCWQCYPSRVSAVGEIVCGSERKVVSRASEVGETWHIYHRE